MAISIQELLTKLVAGVDLSRFADTRGLYLENQIILSKRTDTAYALSDGKTHDTSGCVFYRCILAADYDNPNSLTIGCVFLTELTHKILCESRRRELDDVDLLGADLQGAQLQDASLQGAQLQDASLQGANLEDASLESANLKGANLQGANLEFADLVFAELVFANLQGANLQGAYLVSADLQGANLQGANLQGAFLEEANLQDANLQGADLRHTHRQDTNLQGAKYNQDTRGLLEEEKAIMTFVESEI